MICQLYWHSARSNPRIKKLDNGKFFIGVKHDQKYDGAVNFRKNARQKVSHQSISLRFYPSQQGLSPMKNTSAF